MNNCPDRWCCFKDSLVFDPSWSNGGAYLLHLQGIQAYKSLWNFPESSQDGCRITGQMVQDHVSSMDQRPYLSGLWWCEQTRCHYGCDSLWFWPLTDVFQGANFKSSEMCCCDIGRRIYVNDINEYVLENDQTVAKHAALVFDTYTYHAWLFAHICTILQPRDPDPIFWYSLMHLVNYKLQICHWQGKPASRGLLMICNLVHKLQEDYWRQTLELKWWTCIHPSYAIMIRVENRNQSTTTTSWISWRSWAFRDEVLFFVWRFWRHLTIKWYFVWVPYFPPPTKTQIRYSADGHESLPQGNVVVLITSETLKRMWCAAEISSAYHAGTNIVTRWGKFDKHL